MQHLDTAPMPSAFRGVRDTLVRRDDAARIARPPAAVALESVEESLPRNARARPVAAAAIDPPALRPRSEFGPPPPALFETHRVHEGIEAQGQGGPRGVLGQHLHRAIVRTPAPAQQTEMVVTWLLENNFLRCITGLANQRHEFFYGHDIRTSTLFESERDGVSIARSLPWLRREDVRAVRALLINRTHARWADPRSCPASCAEAIYRYFVDVHERRGTLRPVLVPDGMPGAGLVKLPAYHMDDVYFLDDEAAGYGQQGDFFVGITQRNHPVGIKRIPQGGVEESRMLRRLQVGGYLNLLHHDVTYMVTPLYSGDLNDYAGYFLRVPGLKNARAKQRLVGGRYLLYKTMGELTRLHDEMRGIHQDIKGGNILVARAQRRLVLGDYGVACEQGAGGYGPVQGRTRGSQAPEQAAEQPFVSAACDVFSLCVTAINLMLQHDPAVAGQWTSYWREQPRPSHLFVTEAGHPDVIAYDTWHSYMRRTAVEPQTEMTALANLYGIRDAERDAYIYKYHCISSVFRRLDPILWRQLLRGLQITAQNRVRAAQFCDGSDGAQPAWLTEEEKKQMQRVWTTIPEHSDAIAGALRRVRERAMPLLRRAPGTPRRPG